MRIAVLVSGGVDSSVAVELLHRQGHDLTLFYIRIGMEGDGGDCSADEDIEMCQLVARKYGLPLNIVSLHDEYWEYVMQYTLDTVAKGLTPHPDMMCNRIIKFGFFEERWGKDFDKTATGHYASVEERDGKFWLKTAVDPVKDQTDFLARLSQKQLSHILFPLGDLPKSRVREIAAEAGLPTAKRKDSQGICFLGKINYNDFIERHLGTREGPVVEIETGRKIGTHRGFWFHTIGQRKGLGLSGGPWYVVRKNVRDNVVYVSRGYETPKQYGRRIDLQELEWLTVDPFSEEKEAPQPFAFKNRHSPHFFEGEMTCNPDGSFTVKSKEDIQGIAPGQYVIIYTADRHYCLGSAMIVAPGKTKHHSHGRQN